MQICPNQMLPKHFSGIIQVVIPNQLWMGQKSAAVDVEQIPFTDVFYTLSPAIQVAKKLHISIYSPSKTTNKKNKSNLNNLWNNKNCCCSFLSIQNIIPSFPSSHLRIQSPTWQDPWCQTCLRLSSEMVVFRWVISVEKGTVSPRKMKRWKEPKVNHLPIEIRKIHFLCLLYWTSMFEIRKNPFLCLLY